MNFLLMFDSSSDDDDDGQANQNRIRYRRERIFRPRVTVPRHISTFREEFRADAPVADLVLNLIGASIEHQTTKNHALSPREQLFTVLRFLGTNAPYHSICNMQGPNKSTVCRTLFRMIHAINEIVFPEYVRFPEDTVAIPLKFEPMGGRFV